MWQIFWREFTKTREPLQYLLPKIPNSCIFAPSVVSKNWSHVATYSRSKSWSSTCICCKNSKIMENKQYIHRVTENVSPCRTYSTNSNSGDSKLLRQVLGNITPAQNISVQSVQNVNVKEPRNQEDNEPTKTNSINKLKTKAHFDNSSIPTKLRFLKISEDAYDPVKGSKHAAGYDLRSSEDCEVKAKSKLVCKTGLKIKLPEGCYGRIAPRSGLAVKKFIDVGAGVIDYDYRGEIGVVLFNFGDETFEVKKGDRIAQLICEKIFYPELEEVKTLDDTERGDGGFGSSGMN